MEDNGSDIWDCVWLDCRAPLAQSDLGSRGHCRYCGGLQTATYLDMLGHYKTEVEYKSNQEKYPNMIIQYKKFIDYIEKMNLIPQSEYRLEGFEAQLVMEEELRNGSDSILEGSKAKED